MSAIRLENEAARPILHQVIDARDGAGPSRVVLSFSGGFSRLSGGRRLRTRSRGPGERGRGGRGARGGGQRGNDRRSTACASLTCEQCAQILERALIMEDVIRLRDVRQGRLGSMKDNFQANHHHH